MRGKTTRRQFVKVGAAVVAAPYVIPSHVLGGPNRPAANERVHVALIGSGHRSHDLLKESPADMKLVAVADCDLRQADAFHKFAVEARPDLVDRGCTRYQDYRELLDKEKPDAAIVASTTHARTLICLHAMQAGLDIYAEKPLTLTIEEGRYLIRAESKYKTVFQTGTQQRTIPINNFGSDLVRDGAIGKVQTVICPNFIGPERRPPQPGKPKPPEMNWDMWCHQTELIPFDPELHPGLGRWGRWRAYDGGGLGWGVTGWGAHAFDQVQRALGTDDTVPEEIWPEGTGPNCKVTMRYPNGILLKLELPQGKGPGLGAIFIGSEGKIEINRNRVASNPKEIVLNAPEPEDRNIYASVAQRHIQNWIDCVRSRSRPVADATVGHHSSVICHLVNICRELQRKLRWDPKREIFLGDDEANRLRTRPRRAGYKLPEII